MGWIDQQQVSRVIGPAQAANQRRLLWQHQLLGVGVKIGRLNTKLRQQLVHVIDLKIVVFLVPGEDQAAAAFDKVGDDLHVGGTDVRRRRVGSNGFVARIDDEQQFYPGERLALERPVVYAHVEVVPHPLGG